MDKYIKKRSKWNPEEKWLKEDDEKIIPLSKELCIRDGMCLCLGNVENYIIMKEISEYMHITEIEDKVKRLHYIIFSEQRKI